MWKVRATTKGITEFAEHLVAERMSGSCWSRLALFAWLSSA